MRAGDFSRKLPRITFSDIEMGELLEGFPCLIIAEFIDSQLGDHHGAGYPVTGLAVQARVLKERDHGYC